MVQIYTRMVGREKVRIFFVVIASIASQNATRQVFIFVFSFDKFVLAHKLV